MIKKLENDLILSWILFIFFSLLYFSSTVGVMNSVDAPQYALTQALVEKHTTSIEAFSQYVWPDFASYNGHMYSDREPGFSIIAIPFYLIAKILLPLANYPYLGQHPALTPASRLEVLTYGFMSSLAALGPVLVFYISRKLNFSRFSSFLAGFFLGTGSLMWKYSAGFIRQPLILVMLLGLFLIYLQLKQRRKPSILLMTGFLMGLMLITDYLSIFSASVLALLYAVFIFKQKKDFLILSIIYAIIGFIIPMSFLLLYNRISFGKFFTSSRFYYANETQTVQSTFITDLKWSIPLNLLSYKPIPPQAFDYLKKYPYLKKTFPIYTWASAWQYKGILIQSPILFLSLLGLLIMKQKKMAGILMILFLSYFIPASKISAFFSPTSYDTRYVLPAIGFLFIGLSSAIDALNRQIKPIKLFGLVISSVLGVFSFWNGFVSIGRHFAPHVSGEHRFDYSGSLLNYKNLLSLTIHAFPNIYNIHLSLIFCVLLFFLSKKYPLLIPFKRRRPEETSIK